MIERLQYAVAWTFVKTLGALPRPMARALAAGATRLLVLILPKLRKTAEFNLKLAFPDWTEMQRRVVMKQMTRNRSGRTREFFGWAKPWEGRAVSNWAYRSVGAFLLRPCFVRISTALHGAAAG
jgi:lauroyl/myristoyl acyltransferase